MTLIEEALYGLDHGVHTLELGAGVEFRSIRDVFSPDNSIRPLPVGDGAAFLSASDEDDLARDLGLDRNDLADTDVSDVFTDLNTVLYSDTYRLFRYADVTEPYVFIPLMIVLIAIPVLLSMYAGFGVVRRQRVLHPGMGVLLGAVVGPIWAFAALILNAMVHKEVIAKAEGDSVFVMFLLGGAALGSLGGLLATKAASQAPKG